jgi:hypothetical protein
MGGPTYRGWRLDGPLRELHRAVDRLRFDTLPALLTHQQRPAGMPLRRGRQQPCDGQPRLPDPTSTSEQARS